jgi:asparagine synthase (glutamine-hydrolysing)
MCGIAGIIKKNHSSVKESDLVSLVNSIRHRGPDGQGYYINDSVSLGHARLSIIDVENGTQPMSNEDSTVILTYNGEIYNYKILQNELKELGYSFKTQSDTEVVLKAYEHWGKDCVKKFDGMFAFAIIDFKKEICLLARDQFGIKPLVYRVEEDFIAFCSELPGLKNLYYPVKSGSKQAMEQYFTLNYIAAPLTIYKNIFKLEPGHTLTVSLDGNILSKDQYFKPVFSALKKKWESSQIDKVLSKKIHDKMMSDVPFGVFLSGGIDSSYVAAKMARTSSADFKAYSIGFEGPHSEIKYAEYVAEKLNLELVQKNVHSTDLEYMQLLVKNNLGEPFGDNSIIPTWHVCNLASKDVKMVVTGDGGDEFFAGYHNYISWLQASFKEKLREKIQKKQLLGIPRFILGSLKARTRKNYLKDLRNRYFEAMAYFPENTRKKLLRQSDFDWDSVLSFVELPETKIDYLSFAQLMDIQGYLPNDILQKVDIASMANSLETRPAFVDTDLFKIASELTNDQKVKEKQGKYFLKKLSAQEFNEEFAFRRKQGFGVPNETWFKENNESITFMKSKIFQDHVFNYIDKKTVQEIWDEFIGNRSSFGPFSQVWLIFVFALWLDDNINIDFS